MVDAVAASAVFSFGLLSSFSPCLFPLLPSYVATSVRAKQSQKQAILSSLALISGIIVVFFLIGLVSSTFLGAFLLDNVQILATIQAALLVIAGLIMIRTPSFIYKIRLPSKIENAIYDEEKSKNMYLFNFILGLLYTIIAAPCAAGYFLAVWGFMLDISLLDQFLLVVIFSIAAGLPFLVMSLFLPEIQGETIGKIHSTSSTLSKIMGVIFVGVGIWLYLDVNPGIIESINDLFG